MSQNLQPTPRENLPATTESPQLVFSDHFKPYLDVINSDSQRTRAAIYVLIGAMLLIFAAYRNTTYPDWLDSRLSQLQQAADCLETNTNDAGCQHAKKYANSFLYQGDWTTNHDIGFGASHESKRELQEQINIFMRQRTDALTLRLPFFGIALDMNDLGMVCGLLLIAILYVLYASLKSEIDDMEVARAKALRGRRRRDNLELLVMAQVLAPPSKLKLHRSQRSKPEKKASLLTKSRNLVRRIGVGQGLYLLFVLVAVLQYFVLRSDWHTYASAEALQGKRWATIETRVDIGAFLLVCFLCLCCIVQQWKLNKRLNELSKEIEDLEPDPS